MSLSLSLSLLKYYLSVRFNNYPPLEVGKKNEFHIGNHIQFNPYFKGYTIFVLMLKPEPSSNMGNLSI